MTLSNRGCKEPDLFQLSEDIPGNGEGSINESEFQRLFDSVWANDPHFGATNISPRVVSGCPKYGCLHSRESGSNTHEHINIDEEHGTDVMLSLFADAPHTDEINSVPPLVQPQVYCCDNSWKHYNELLLKQDFYTTSFSTTQTLSVVNSLKIWLDRHL